MEKSKSRVGTRTCRQIAHLSTQYSIQFLQKQKLGDWNVGFLMTHVTTQPVPAPDRSPETSSPQTLEKILYRDRGITKMKS